MNLSIEHLRLSFINAAGSEMRARVITRRALEQLHLYLKNEITISGARLDDLSLSGLTIPPLALDLRTLTDEAAAERLAHAMYSALLARWQEG